MPVVELDIGGTPTRVQVGDGYTPDDLDHIAQTLQPPDTSTAWSRAGQYLTHKGSEFVGALQGVQKDVENVVTGQPYGTGFPGTRSGWDTAGDVAQTAAPLVAPELTAAGLGVGTAARAAGADEPTADLANAATQLVGGVGSALYSAGKAVAGAPAALKAAAQAKYGAAAEQAAQAGKTLAMGTDAGDAFAGTLNEALDSALTHPAEKAMGRGLLAKMTAPGSTGVDYADLDNALAGLRKVRGQSYVRGLIDDAAQGLIEGTPAGAARSAAKATFKQSRVPLTTGRTLSTMAGIGGLGSAGYEISQGEYRRALPGLGVALLGAQGLKGLTGRGLMTAAGGAAGPLARTAVGVGSQLPGLAGGQDQGYTEPPVSVPPETPPEAGGSPGPQARAAAPTPIRPLPGPYGREIAAVASLVGIPPEVIQTHMMQESAGHPGALSHPEAGQAQTPAHGLMQITPGTFASVAGQVHQLTGQRPDLGNPLHNILAGGLLLRKYLDKTNGDWGLASKMYFGGENPAGWGARTEQYSRDISRRAESVAGG